MHFRHTPKFTAEFLRNTFPAPDSSQSGDTYWVLVRESGVCVPAREGMAVISTEPPGQAGCDPVRTVYIGHYDGTPCIAAEISG